MENLDSCITAMQRSLVMSKDALQVELSVSLFVYASLGAADIQSKKTLRGVYASAGRFDCLYPDSPSYSSVSRYMERSAILYAMLGKKKILRAIRSKPDDGAIDAIMALIAPLEIMSWDDVSRKATGEPRKSRAPAVPPTEQHRRATDFAEPIVHLVTECMHIVVAKNATADEIKKAIGVLRDLLKTLQGAMAQSEQPVKPATPTRRTAS